MRKYIEIEGSILRIDNVLRVYLERQHLALVYNNERHLYFKFEDECEIIKKYEEIKNTLLSL